MFEPPCIDVTPRSELLAAAVADNIRWCSSVCATDAAVQDAGVWVTPRAPHPLFPDLVTARSGVAGAVVAAHLEGRAPCSVKDSFADLDLTPHGFAVLFDAQWIGMTAANGRPSATSWSVIDSAAGLARWSQAAGLPVSLPAHILADPRTQVLVGSGDDPLRGFVATTTGRVVGVSNVFAPTTGSVWPDVIAGLGALFPGRSVVGYESGPDLDDALAAGFEALGPLRVWTRDIVPRS